MATKKGKGKDSGDSTTAAKIPPKKKPAKPAARADDGGSAKVKKLINAKPAAEELEEAADEGAAVLNEEDTEEGLDLGEANADAEDSELPEEGDEEEEEEEDAPEEKEKTVIFISKTGDADRPNVPNCLGCGHLVGHASRMYSKCHYSNGNEDCPAKDLRIVKGLNVEAAATALAEANRDVDIDRQLKILANLREYDQLIVKQVHSRAQEILSEMSGS